ncbi:MAG TPA: dihydrolipoamide acetyltransferase family protein [Chthonomonadales bacterium]|nr:dihydrolipoamide acetyltransferase family protein [Chthonomonadales bacterium]
MPVEVILPQLGESVAEGVITRWLKKPGDMVAQDEPLVEISTDKVNVELPAPVSGVLQELKAAEGQTVPVEEVIAIIAPAEEVGMAEAPSPEPAAETPMARSAPQAEATEATARRHYSPLVRRIAEEHGIDLDSLVSTGQLVGTGENRRITKQDLLNYIARVTGQPAQAPAPGDGAKTPPTPAAPDVVPATPPTITPTPPARPVAPPMAAAPEPSESAEEIIVPFTGMRKMIADHLSKSAFTAVHVTTVAQADVTKLVAFRAANKEVWEKEHGVRLTYTPFFIKAACDALLAFPMVNSTIEGERIIAKKYVHMGVAVSLGEGGLIVPVIKDAHKKDVITLAREVEELARKAREGRLLPSDVQGGTFSITNPGVFGAILSTPIIHAPQSAILGVEAIQKMPVVREDDSIAIRSMMYLCLSYDHRVIDGETAIRFLQHIRRTLEEFQFFR